ncbi:NAD-binding protein [Dactylosporangium sp. NPDC049140]|uniref:NAD-binding protein n=1 Tax=Dactylosporangium sp. NPDC049140 TaxID=3155647 RepID=UPI003401115C
MTSESWLMRRLRGNLPRVQAITRPWSIEPVGATERHVVHAPAKRVVVCGDDPLAHRLVAELVQQYGVHVTVILPSAKRRHGPDIVRLLAEHGPGGRVIEAERPDTEAFERADLAGADALALVKQDDIGNLDAALQAQELNPRIRLVIRMFNLRLGHSVRRNFADVRVLSDAQMAAPAFVSEALGEVAPVHVRVAQRTLFVARRAEVRPEDVVCGLARTDAELLPKDNADLVLAVANGERAATVIERGERPDRPPAVRESRLRRWWRRQLRSPLHTLRGLVGRKLWLTALVLVAMLAAGTAIIAHYKHISWWNAAYVTLLAELTGASPDLESHWPEKLVTTLLGLVNVALIPVITAAVVEAVVNARLALALGRLREPVSGHVVVVGLGNVGTRVMHSFVDLGVPVVVIDRNENARGAQAARSRGVPFIVGDASNVETLRAASVDTCRALVVVSTDDQANLEAALESRALKPDLRVILRLFDGRFADRVQRAFGITASRSVSYLAAPAFAAALLEREVIGTIPVGRRVLLLAEVPIVAGSRLDGRPVATAQDVGEVRVLAVATDGQRRTVWAPPDSYVLRADDLLTVVTTRLGLGGLLAHTGGTVDASS